MRLPPGKVPWELIADLVEFELPADVRLGPACGEDAAAVEIGGETWVVASDPITFTAENAGYLAVIVNANDIAVRGAVPRFFLPVILISPEEAVEDRVREILEQIRRTCSELEIAVIGGHTEVTEGLPRSLVVGTMLGKVSDRLITTGGLQPGDQIGMVRWSGLEGTAILAAEFAEQLQRGCGAEVAFGLDELLSSNWLSVVDVALAASRVEGVSSLHDVTEGGVGEALHELSTASGLQLEIQPESIPLLPQTKRICELLGLDPLGLIGSGALLVGSAPEACRELEEKAASLDVPLTWIGSATRQGAPVQTVPRFPRDQLLNVFAIGDVDAVLFDMDGTLIRSVYDWPAIRAELGITQDSIIDQLNGLSEPERSAKWSELERIEEDASAKAELHEGVFELLELLGLLGLKTALVTNNNQKNTRTLVDRFRLKFDVVINRDGGFWKPSGAPLEQAAQKLGVTPSRCLAVGDSRYDIASARAAGCGLVCTVFDTEQKFRGQSDLSFADLRGLTKCLRIVRAS